MSGRGTWQQKLINPVLDKEFRLRMRTIRSPISLMFYLLAIGLLALGFLFLSMGGFDNRMVGFNPNRSREMFYFLSVAQLALIAFMTPGLTAGVISGEREKQTLNILLTTQQSSTTIILSKLAASLSFMLLVIIATLPVYSIVFLFGGISPGQLVLVFAFYVFCMIMLGAIGVLCSVLFKRTMIAVIATYGIAGFIFGGTGLLYLFMREIVSQYMSYSVAPTTTYSAVGYIAGLNPVAALISVFEPEMTRRVFYLWGYNPTQSQGPALELWQFFVIVYTVLTVIVLLLSIRYIRPVLKKRKSKA